ncbi:MAG TPA: GntR family transcriptional regulator [Candidatus Competibacteraceae bacterium]|mgnify:CR=1 FL=1|nr:GntR family transcriptional regulator [Candidatus Competibacteraceae bacterium]
MSYSDALVVLKQHSLPDLVQDELEQLILDGKLAPGEPLREIAIASLLGVSRGPVREAFRALEEKGLLRIAKNCGVSVRALSAGEADQIYEVRIVLEAMIGRKVAETITETGLAELKAILKAMVTAAKDDNVHPYTYLNLAFHDALARLSGNVALHESYRRLVAQLTLFRHKAYLHDRTSMALSLREHQEIVSAIEAQKPNRASDLLRSHARDSRKRLHAALGRSARP